MTLIQSLQDWAADRKQEHFLVQHLLTIYTLDAWKSNMLLLGRAGHQRLAKSLDMHITSVHPAHMRTLHFQTRLSWTNMNWVTSLHAHNLSPSITCCHTLLTHSHLPYNDRQVKMVTKVYIHSPHYTVETAWCRGFQYAVPCTEMVLIFTTLNATLSRRVHDIVSKALQSLNPAISLTFGSQCMTAQELCRRLKV